MTESKSFTAEAQVTLCLEILQMFKQTFERSDLLSVEIRYVLFSTCFLSINFLTFRNVLLFTLLAITTTLLKPDNPNQTLAKSLAGVIVDTLLFTWISTKIRDPEMWARLQEGMQSTFHRIEPIHQTKVLLLFLSSHSQMKLIQLALVYKDFLYPQSKKKKVRQPTRSESKKSSSAQTPDYRKGVTVEKDSSIASISWDLDSVSFLFHSLLGKCLFEINE